MVAFEFQGLLDAGPASYLTGISDLDIYWRDGVPVLYASSGPSGGITSYSLTAGGPVFLDRDPFVPGQLQATPGQLEEITVSGETVLVTLGRHDTTPQCFDLAANGEISGTGQLTAEGGFPAAIVSMETVETAAGSYVYASHWGMDGVTVYAINASGTLVQTGHVGLTSTDTQSADLVAIESVAVGGQTYLLTASALNDSVTCYRLGQNGMPEMVGTLGADSGLPIAAPTALVPVSVGGVQYLVVAAAGSSSLTVLRLDPGGAMVAIDHVIDDLGTRFQSVTALETVTVGDQVFLVAGGGDDGLSLFTLLPDGVLVHLGQIADSTQTALTNITALALHATGSVIDIFASGGGEAGITHLSVDLGMIGQTVQAGAGGATIEGSAGRDILLGGDGNDNLRGNDGDDILVDGAGTDKLRGGAGADIFRFVADGVRDTVEDFEFGIDRLDLSGLGRIYSLAQLSIQSTVWGAKIYFGTEEIRLFSKNGLPLDVTAFEIGDLVDMTHFPVDMFVFDGPIIGGEGTDMLNGGVQNDMLDGRGGDDVLNGMAGDDTLIAGAGDDLASGGAGNDALYGNAGADTLQGGDGNDLLKGGTQDDDLYGGDGSDRLYGGDGVDRLFGGNGNDKIYGGKDQDIIHGDAGDDLLYGEGNGDILYGDEGNDVVFGEGGHDVVNGGAGDDTLSGGDDRDTLRGDAGDDQLYGGRGVDWLYGGNGHDLIYTGGDGDKAFGGKGNDTLRGEDGDDTLSGDDGNDFLRGDAGDDKLYGGARGDELVGGAGQDWLYGEDGGDKLYGGTENDVLSGAAGRDTLSGGDGDDTLYGGLDRDRLFGDAGSDLIYGGSGNDRAYGGSGNDTLRGEDGNDALYGDDGNDFLRGDAGDDKLYGGTGKDRLIGGAGNDTLTGGGSIDTFVFAGNFGADVITDFAAQSDAERIDLAGVSTITDFADLLANHMLQVGADVWIYAGSGNTITLQNVSLGDLDGNDFIF